MTLEEISGAAGVPVRVLRAIATIESRGDVRAVRFEARLYRERGADPTGIRGTGRDAVREAIRRNLRAGVESTSWGRWQVLGAHGAAIYSGDHRRFVEAFEASPGHVSDLLAVQWWRANPRAAAAARDGDWRELARRYNGSSSSPWLGRFMRALEAPEAASSSRSSSAALVLGAAALAAVLR